MKWTKQIMLYVVWACMYILCICLGMLADPQGLLKVLLAMVAAGFFVPGFMLVIRALRKEDRKQLRWLRIIAIASLSLTVLSLVGSFLAVNAGETVGNILHGILVFVSVPMLCGQYWAMSLFLWACLLMSAIPGVILPKKK